MKNYIVAKLLDPDTIKEDTERKKPNYYLYRGQILQVFAQTQHRQIVEDVAKMLKDTDNFAGEADIDDEKKIISSIKLIN